MSFTLSIPNSLTLHTFKIVMVSLLLSILIIFPTMGFMSIQSIVCVLLLTVLFYILISTMTSEDLQNEMPSTLYPPSPRLGLDGISLSNYYSGSSLERIRI
jgi:hypothetical protein